MFRGRLKREDERCIQINYLYLQKNLEARDIVNFLYQHEVISLDDKERICGGRSQLERNEILLDILLKCGPGEAFNWFLKSLEERYIYVLNEMQRKAEETSILECLKIQTDSLNGVCESLRKEIMNVRGEMTDLQHKNTAQSTKIKQLLQTQAELQEKSKIQEREINLLKALGGVTDLIEELVSCRESDVYLLLIGKGGSGKSALGNTILNRNAFLSRASTKPITSKIHFEVSEINGRVIHVVDGPGYNFFFCPSGDIEVSKLVIDALSDAILLNQRGYHAFLYVTRYGLRITEEEEDSIKFYKRIFGETFLKDFGILVMTCGDDFGFESYITFQDWCKQQTGTTGKLMKEFNNKVLLFDNKTKDQSKKDSQLNSLIQMVDNLYFDKNFEMAQISRIHLMIEAMKALKKEKKVIENEKVYQRKR